MTGLCSSCTGEIFRIPLSGVAFYLFALRFKGRNKLPQDRSDARALIQFLKGEYFISCCCFFFFVSFLKEYVALIGLGLDSCDGSSTLFGPT